MNNPDTLLAEWSFSQAAQLKPVTSGLINETFVILDPSPTAILQRLNTAIFKAQVHEDIEAVTSHLERQGLATPRLVHCTNGRLWHEAPDGSVWRVLNYLGDRTIERLEQPNDALSAGSLIAQFHHAVSSLQWHFRSVRPGAHDTKAHMERMIQAVEEHRTHRLWEQVAPLAEDIFEAWEAWSGPTELPTRIIHGDLKISNLRFRGTDALCLIDLDTLADGTLDVELGDAMRSWCNPASENSESTYFESTIFEAAMTGYANGSQPGSISEMEWQAILPGTERICLELASRFAWDALAESYFGFDERYGGRGEHNLLRARGQASLARSVQTQRSTSQSVMDRLWRGMPQS